MHAKSSDLRMMRSDCALLSSLLQSKKARLVATGTKHLESRDIQVGKHDRIQASWRLHEMQASSRPSDLQTPMGHVTCAPRAQAGGPVRSCGWFKSV